MKKNYKIALAFILGILVSGTSVYAATKYLASDVTYKDKTVEDALNELYSKSSSSCGETLVGTTWNFGYIGTEDVFVVPLTGTYKLETWGAQGGQSTPGAKLYSFGGYSQGTITLKANDKLYINVGGQGGEPSTNKTTGYGIGGYNGGGNGGNPYNEEYAGGYGGGGATHIAKVSGVLSSLENNVNDILIVSGGGGGGYADYITLSHAGGFEGTSGYSSNGTNGSANGSYIVSGATQTTGYAFGLGQAGRKGSDNSYSRGGTGGGGGGFYGGYAIQTRSVVNTNGSGAGGSSYIGNPLLKEKSMYCYNCTESNEENTKTISTTNVSEKPTSNYVKQGHGYAKITLVSLK